MIRTRLCARSASLLFVAACARASREPAIPEVYDTEATTLAGDTGADPASLATEEADAGASPEQGDASTRESAHAIVIADEPLYAPGARARARGAIAASADDEMVAKWNRGGFGTEDDAPPGTKAPHPAPRIKVDVVRVKGRVSQGDVQRLARSKGYWPFRLCYEEGLRRSQNMHGAITLRMTLAASGAARNVRKVAAALDDPAVVACAVKAARSLVLAAPERGAPEVALEISFWPGDDPIRAATAPNVPFDSRAIVTAMRDRWAAVKTCYQAGIERRPGLWGRLAVRLRIAPSGEIVESSEIESRFPDADVALCAIRALARAPIGPRPAETVVVYALRFSTAPSADAGASDAGP